MLVGSFHHKRKPVSQLAKRCATMPVLIVGEKYQLVIVLGIIHLLGFHDSVPANSL